MNDQQLETVLRRSLARHADTVASGPTWPPSSVATDERPADLLVDDELAARRARRRGPSTWWPVAAAVAAVLVVIGVALAVRHVTADHSRPATPTTITRTVCMTTLPNAWSDAVAGGELPGSIGNEPLGIGPDGEVLAPLLSGTDSDQAELGLVGPNGSIQPIIKVALSDIYRSTSFDIFSFQTAAIDRRWIVLPMMSVGFKDITVRLDLIDRSNPHNVREIQTSTDPDKIALFDDHVYWIEGNKGKATSSLQDYDIASGRTREVTRQAKYLAATPHGVAWTDAHDASHVLAGSDPTRAPGQTAPGPELVSDGSNYAWWTDDGIAWYSNASKQTVVVRGLDPGDKGHAVAAVAGPYVLVLGQDDGDARVVDAHTGAVGRFAQVGHVLSAGGTVVYDGEHGLVRLDLTRLPGLHC